ncbi:hypothetical protein OMP38_27750 [Cohnella ginsengisoli]|uniref:Uncharacterized protein n=1 Tax=Cohnella ginsengisoli TaxID=425004 RepID=A0A9X4KM27_9BACL|nr:hypothetical protein [Cohnella ginsengisoli]MDG0794206.1 hypothetical protein [Cohnella ginsengisoli]
MGRSQKVDGLEAQRLKHAVEDALAAERGERDADDDDPGYEVRQVNDRLYRFLEKAVFDFIQHERHHDACWKREQQLERVQVKRVEKNADHVGRVEDGAEVPQPHPRAVRESLEGAIIFECDYQTEHRQVFVDDEINQSRQQEQVEKAILPDLRDVQVSAPLLRLLRKL